MRDFKFKSIWMVARMVAESSLKNICKKVTEIIISMIYVFKAEGDLEAMRRCDKDSG